MATDDTAHCSVRLMKVWRKCHPPGEASDLEAFWDSRADAFDRRCADRSSRDYAAALVRRIHELARLQPADTCLDLGCGTGSLALPLAKRLGSVTACDISGQMIRHLQARARQEHLDNVVALQRRWMDLVPFRDIGAHDLVIAHRSLSVIACDREGTPDFVDCITRMNQLARRAVFIIPRAFDLPADDQFADQFPEFARGPAGRAADLATLNLLFAMGIFPCLDYVSLRQVRRFASVEEEVAGFGYYFGVTAKRRLKRLGEYLTRHATRHDDGYSLPTATRVLLMWWPKAL